MTYHFEYGMGMSVGYNYDKQTKTTINEKNFSRYWIHAGNDVCYWVCSHSERNKHQP
jgi:hypothetical protein